MPLVQLCKARRSQRLKGRPEWQRLVPDDPELRESYRIAADNVGQFSRAFLQVQRDLLDDDAKRAIKRKWREGGGLSDILSAIPTFTQGADDPEVWRRFVDKLRLAYFRVVSESGVAEMTRLNRQFKTDFRFRIMDENLEVIKARRKVRVPVVPVNPYSVKWMEEQSLKLVTQGISATQTDVIRAVITDSFERGLRAETVMEEIERNIGLTTREFNAVARRRLLHEEAGLSKVNVKSLTDKYTNRLLKKRAERIARTETIAAQAHGRNTAWRVASESGRLPEVERVWASSPDACEDCMDLDGKTAGLNESYESAELGAVSAPPAHPHCRCTELLRRKTS